MKISFIYISNRPGSIDILAYNMMHQQPVPGHEFELVVVDGLPERYQSGKVPPYLAEHNINVGWYGPPIPRTFSFASTGFTNAMNTGLLHASGDYVVFLHDYTSITPQAFENWIAAVQAYGPRSLVHGVAVVYEATPPAPDKISDLVVETGPWMAREPWVPYHFEMGYWIAPISFFEESNGIDVRADFRSDWALKAVTYQASIRGYRLSVERLIVYHMLDHRIWHKEGLENSMWKTWGVEVNADMPEPQWSPWSCNPFNFREQRLSYLRERHQNVQG